MFSHYVAVALKNIRGAPLASLVSLLTLSVGLVCFVTAYAFVTFWGTAEQHFPKAKNLYVLALSMKSRDGKSGFFGGGRTTIVPDVAAEFLKSDYPAITKIARAVVIDRKTMIASGGRAERLFGAAVDPEFLDMFDLPFIAGDPHAALASPRSVVLTRDAAARLFGSDNPIGKAVVIGNSVDATVTGVIDAIPEPSHLGRSANARLPFDLLASRDIYDSLGRGGPFGGGPIPERFAWTVVNATIYLYLPPSGGLSADALSAKLGDFVQRHVPAETLKNQSYSFSLVPVKDLLKGSSDFFGSGLSFSAALLLLGGLVLGVACVNYANLATARAARRVREIGVRKALGASPTQVVVQSLFEAGALTLAALIVALAAFVLVQPLIKGLLGAEVGANFFSHLAAWPSLGALVIAVALAAGAYPAFVLSRVRPMSAIATARGRLGSALFSTLLVGTQFAVASFLLIAVTVISMQNAEMRRTALKGLTDPLVVIDNPARRTKVSAATLRERLEALPQVRGVTELRSTPWEFLMMTNVTESPDPTAPQRGLEVREVGFDFFRVFDVPLLAGRVFDREHAEDLPREGSAGPLGAGPGPAPGGPPKPPAAPDASNPPPPTNIVVEASVVAALNLGTPEQAIDKLIYRPTPPVPGAKPQPPMRIIGVVENRAFTFFKTPLKTFGAMYSLQPNLDVTVARVAATDIAGGLKSIDAAWKQLAPNVAISRRFLDDIFAQAYSYNVRINELFGFLAATAFAICVAGLFGMATFVAGRRRREIGVRKTLGGSTRQMVTLLLAGFTKPVLIANLIAWPAGYLAARRYLNQFPQSIDLTLWPFLLSVAITVAIAWLAVVGQTLRAARTAPGEVLRHE